MFSEFVIELGNVKRQLPAAFIGIKGSALCSVVSGGFAFENCEWDVLELEDAAERESGKTASNNGYPWIYCHVVLFLLEGNGRLYNKR